MADSGNHPRDGAAHDIVSVIDELIAEEICPKCGRVWHELPLTDHLLKMFESGKIDGYYFGWKDESKILCEGSSFIGPQRPDPVPTARPLPDHVPVKIADNPFLYSMYEQEQQEKKKALEQYFLAKLMPPELCKEIFIDDFEQKAKVGSKWLTSSVMHEELLASMPSMTVKTWPSDLWAT